jgi:hypothetical protein
MNSALKFLVYSRVLTSIAKVEMYWSIHMHLEFGTWCSEPGIWVLRWPIGISSPFVFENDRGCWMSQSKFNWLKFWRVIIRLLLVWSDIGSAIYPLCTDIYVSVFQNSMDYRCIYLCFRTVCRFSCNLDGIISFRIWVFLCAAQGMRIILWFSGFVRFVRGCSRLRCLFYRFEFAEKRQNLHCLDQEGRRFCTIILVFFVSNSALSTSRMQKHLKFRVEFPHIVRKRENRQKKMFQINSELSKNRSMLRMPFMCSTEVRNSYRYPYALHARAICLMHLLGRPVSKTFWFLTSKGLRWCASSGVCL